MVPRAGPNRRTRRSQRRRRRRRRRRQVGIRDGDMPIPDCAKGALGHECASLFAGMRRRRDPLRGADDSRADRQDQVAQGSDSRQPSTRDTGSTRIGMQRRAGQAGALRHGRAACRPAQATGAGRAALGCRAVRPPRRARMPVTYRQTGMRYGRQGRRPGRGREWPGLRGGGRRGAVEQERGRGRGLAAPDHVRRTLRDLGLRQVGVPGQAEPVPQGGPAARL